jgi:mRNA interferase RelE/StbE
MKLARTPHFLRSYAKAPDDIQRTFAKQAKLLLDNLGHPSLRAKKYDESRDLWQARVTRDWRFYFTIEGDTYVLHDIMAHPK